MQAPFGYSILSGAELTSGKMKLKYYGLESGQAHGPCLIIILRVSEAGTNDEIER